MENTTVAMLAFFALFIAVIELFSRFKKTSFVFFLLCLPSLLVPNSNRFMQIKTFSVLIPLCFLIYARFKPRIESFLARFIYVVIILNIVEASVIDVTTKNFTNIVAAIGLIVLLPYDKKNWQIDGKRDDFLVHMPKYWPYLYTTWNLCFLYSSRITTFGYALPLLLAPLLYAVFLKRSDLYFQARAYSFGFYLFFRTVLADHPIMNMAVFDLTTWYSEGVAASWGAINLVFTVACFYLQFSKQGGAGFSLGPWTLASKGK